MYPSTNYIFITFQEFALNVVLWLLSKFHKIFFLIRLCLRRGLTATLEICTAILVWKPSCNSFVDVIIHYTPTCTRNCNYVVTKFLYQNHTNVWKGVWVTFGIECLEFSHALWAKQEWCYQKRACGHQNCENLTSYLLRLFLHIQN